MIRSYGPGKFDSVLDSYLHELSLDGTCEELGDVETFNHYTAVELGEDAIDELPDDLTEDEKNLVRTSHAAILEETSSGFVYVTYYSSEKNFEHQWEELEAAWAEFEEEDDE